MFGCEGVGVAHTDVYTCVVYRIVSPSPRAESAPESTADPVRMIVFGEKESTTARFGVDTGKRRKDNEERKGRLIRGSLMKLFLACARHAENRVGDAMQAPR